MRELDPQTTDRLGRHGLSSTHRLWGLMVTGSGSGTCSALQAVRERSNNLFINIKTEKKNTFVVGSCVLEQIHLSLERSEVDANRLHDMLSSSHTLNKNVTQTTLNSGLVATRLYTVYAEHNEFCVKDYRLLSTKPSKLKRYI